MRFFSTGLFMVAGTVCMTLLAACSSNDKAVSFESGGITHTFTEGQVAHDFPLPIYPKAQTTGSVEAKGDADETSKFMMFTSDDKVEAISQFYQTKLKEEGWQLVVTSPLPTLVNIGAKKNDLDASVMISVGDGQKTTISLSVSHESKDATKVPAENFTVDKLNPPTD